MHALNDPFMATTSSPPRRDMAGIKVVCLGLSRTGTTSLSAALEILGFGPCFHTYNLLMAGKLDMYPWITMAEENSATPENLDNALQGYCSVLDQPAALFAEPLYKAYPDAKFILTIRESDKWERSMQDTVLVKCRQLLQEEPKEEPTISYRRWVDCKLTTFQPDLFTDTKAVYARHNANVQSLIPPDRLLVFNVKQGWEPLIKFLDVENPQVPFPHLNDLENFKGTVLTSL